MQQEHRVRIGEGGRVIIPAPYRRAMGVQPGDELIIHMYDGELRLFSQAEALKRLRAAVKPAHGKARESKASANRTDDFLAFRKKDSGE